MFQKILVQMSTSLGTDVYVIKGQGIGKDRVCDGARWNSKLKVGNGEKTVIFSLNFKEISLYIFS